MLLTPRREATIKPKEVLPVTRPLQVQGLLILKRHVVLIRGTPTEVGQMGLLFLKMKGPKAQVDFKNAWGYFWQPSCSTARDFLGPSPGRE